MYIYNQFERLNGRNGYVFVNEWVDASPGNVDIDLTLFQVLKLQNDFPLGIKQIIHIDIPQPILDFGGPEIFPFLPELNKTLVWIPHENVSQYIDPENYPAKYKTWLASHPIKL